MLKRDTLKLKSVRSFCYEISERKSVITKTSTRKAKSKLRSPRHISRAGVGPVTAVTACRKLETFKKRAHSCRLATAGPQRHGPAMPRAAVMRMHQCCLTPCPSYRCRFCHHVFAHPCLCHSLGASDIPSKTPVRWFQVAAPDRPGLPWPRATRSCGTAVAVAARRLPASARRRRHTPNHCSW